MHRKGVVVKYLNISLVCAALCSPLPAFAAEADTGKILPAKGLICQTRAQMDTFVALIQKNATDGIALRDSTISSGPCIREKVFYDHVEEVSKDIHMPRFGIVRIVRLRVVIAIREEIRRTIYGPEITVRLVPMVPPVNRFMLVKPEGEQI